MNKSGEAAADDMARHMVARLRLRHLSLLVLLKQHGTLRRVAMELSVTQPAVTKSLQEIEEIVESPLFERHATGMAANALGQLLMERASAILADIRRTAGDVVAMREGHRGQLRVGVTPFIPQTLLVETVTGLGRAGCTFKFALVDGSTDVLVSQLREHRLDCVIGRLAPGRNDDLHQEILYEQKPVLTVSRCFTAAEARALTWSSLEQLAWLLPPEATPLRMAFEAMLARRSVSLPPPLFEATSVSAISEMMRSNDRVVSVLPDELAKRLERQGDARCLKHIRLDFRMPPVALIRRIALTEDAVLDRFCSALRSTRVG